MSSVTTPMLERAQGAPKTRLGAWRPVRGEPLTGCGSQRDGRSGRAQGLADALWQRLGGVCGVQRVGQDEHVVHAHRQHQERNDLQHGMSYSQMVLHSMQSDSHCCILPARQTLVRQCEVTKRFKSGTKQGCTRMRPNNLPLTSCIHYNRKLRVAMQMPSIQVSLTRSWEA